MLIRLFLLFTLVPLLELALLIRLGQWIGLGATLILVAGTGLVGAWLARREGVRTWSAVRAELARGRVPGEELTHAFLVVISGAFLVTPGVLTDAAGLLLLLQPVRARVVASLRRRFGDRIRSRGIHVSLGASESGTEGSESGRSRRDPERGPDGWYRRPPPDRRGPGVPDEEEEAGERRGRVIET